MPVPNEYKFIIQLGKTLHQYGAPAHRVENYLQQVAEQQNIHGSFLDYPTWVNFVFYDDDELQSYSYTKAVSPGELDLGSLSKAVEITNNYLNTEIDAETANNQLKNLANTPKKVHFLLQMFAFIFGAASLNFLIGTNIVSTIVSAFSGGLVFFITYFFSKHSYLNSITNSSAAFAVTIIACIGHYLVPEISITPVILSSLIILLPGLGITTAIEEITSKNLVSGTAKLADSFITLFKQFFGVILGFGLCNYFFDIEITTHVSTLPSWTKWIGVPLLSTCSVPIFNTRKKDALLAITTGIIAYLVSYWLSSFPKNNILISTFMSTVVVVLVSKLFNKITQTPKLVFQVQGLILLLPGSKALLGLGNLYLDSPLSLTTNIGQQTTFILMGVIGGLLFSGAFSKKY